MQSLEARDPLTGYWNNPSERRWVPRLELCQWGWEGRAGSKKHFTGIIQSQMKGWLWGWRQERITPRIWAKKDFVLRVTPIMSIYSSNSSWKGRWTEIFLGKLKREAEGTPRWTEFQPPPLPPSTTPHTHTHSHNYMDSRTAPHTVIRETETLIRTFLYAVHFGRKNTRQHSPSFLNAKEQQKCRQHKEIFLIFFFFIFPPSKSWISAS